MLKVWRVCVLLVAMPFLYLLAVLLGEGKAFRRAFRQSYQAQAPPTLPITVTPTELHLLTYLQQRLVQRESRYH